jgi:hypothetical protein
MVFEWGSEFVYSQTVPAQLVGDTLEATRKENGVAAPKALVDAARPIDSPLHGLPFTWDDSEAAEKQRLQEARGIIRALVIREPSGEVSRAPLFVHVTMREDNDTKDGYVPIAVALQTPEWEQQIRNEARRQMIALRNRYQMIEEYAAVWEAIEVVTREPVLV